MLTVAEICARIGSKSRQQEMNKSKRGLFRDLSMSEVFLATIFGEMIPEDDGRREGWGFM
jgi:hypothetical protein